MEPKLATLSVKGQLESGLKNTINVRDLPVFFVDEPERLGGTNTGPNPLEYFLGAFSACTSIILSYVAKELDFSYQEIAYETSGDLDPRGYLGHDGILTYFQKVKIDIVVTTEENDKKFKEVTEVVEQRCPLYNLLVDAGVEVETNWVKR